VADAAFDEADFETDGLRVAFMTIAMLEPKAVAVILATERVKPKQLMPLLATDHLKPIDDVPFLATG
jgi:hypothetical protein